MQSKKFDLEILTSNHVQLRLDYYCSNKEHLEVWHPTTPKGFYTLEYQRCKIKESIDSMNNKKSMHFVMIDKLKNEMIGHCNYTKIKDQKCWLGYSISKKSEGKSLMFEALSLSNSYVYKNLDIKKIRAGILPENKRSIRLIERLGFKYIGKKDELEINGEVRTYDTYIQEMIKESKVYIKKND